MERILVGTSPRRRAFSALNRAIALAKRIKATVHVLFVLPRAEGQAASLPAPAASAEERRLRLLVQQAQQEGVGIEYFMAEGNYEDEVIRFARDRGITLLVSESAATEGPNPERESQSLRRILHGISCRVELVSPRREETATPKKGSTT